MENWYKIALTEERLKILSITEEQLLKEAGMSDILKSIPVWIISAVMALSTGKSEGAIKEQTLEKFNLNKDQYSYLEKVISNRSTVDEIIAAVRQKQNKVQDQDQEQVSKADQTNKEQVNKEQPKVTVKMNEFIDHLLIHEGLEPRQTPIRITFQHMRNWDHILGYDVYKGHKPKDRQNFFYVKNPNDVKPVTTKAFMNYLKDPQRWKLPKNPTIGQAIRVFDQSGSDDKITYLKKSIPNFNENAPLKSLL
jgi:hypothetical protein